MVPGAGFIDVATVAQCWAIRIVYVKETLAPPLTLMLDRVSTFDEPGLPVVWPAIRNAWPAPSWTLATGVRLIPSIAPSSTALPTVTSPGVCVWLSAAAVLEYGVVWSTPVKPMTPTVNLALPPARLTVTVALPAVGFTRYQSSERTAVSLSRVMAGRT